MSVANAAPHPLTRVPTEDDHPRVLAVMDEWWEGLKGPAGARERHLLLPRLFFQHFTRGSRIVETPEGTIVAFLFGFLSESDPASAYIHFVGVHPAFRRGGLATSLYEDFFGYARANGRRWVHAITSPENTRSIAYHTRIGFTIKPSTVIVDGTPVQPNYDGSGNPRVVFRIDLAPTAAGPPGRDGRSSD
jgi:ribosomal protein S18 acetylase RimI-like enzyme